MNVDFKSLNTQDVAKMFGVSRSTVQGWCRAGKMCAQDVSESGSKMPRFLITEAEVARCKKLQKKYGKRAWVKHALEGRDETVLPIPAYRCEPVVKIPETIPEEVVEEVKEAITPFTAVEPTTEPVVKPAAPITEDYSDLPTRSDFDAERVLDTILKIQDLKERLSNIEAERNQIINELKSMKEEILAVI